MQPESKYFDNNLLNAIARGDEGAFRQLFDCYRERVYYYLLKVTKSREISEELLSDIFMKLWIGREWLPDIQNMESFLRRVSHNKAIDYLRYAARNKELQGLIAKEMDIASPESPDLKLLEKDYRRIIAEAVSMLSPQRKIVYRLSREEGLSHDEIATLLSLSINTVSNHVKASLKLIKWYLKGKNTEGLLILFIFFN